MSLSSPLVLVFDRDAAIRAWYSKAFVSTGYRVSEAANGTDALEFLTSQVPDLIITELRPDHRDGLTLGVIKRLNASTADIPIVMMMRDADPDVKAAALLVSAGTLLDKPPSATGVLALANQLMMATPVARVTRRDLYRTLAGLKEAGEGQLPTTMSAAVSSVMLADGQAKCIAVNAAACHLTGYSAAELTARSIWDLGRPDGHERARMLWGRFLVNGQCAGEFLTVHKDGAEVTIQLCAAANIAPGLHAIVVGR
jgi:PAS domain S-box-containing protein